MESIESLVLKYQTSKKDEIFSEIYRNVEKEILKNLSYENVVAKSIGSTTHELREIFDDCVLYTVNKFKEGQAFLPFFIWKFKNKRANFIRDNKNKETFESIDIDRSDGFDKAPLQIPDEFNLENSVLKTRKADQRQLIDSLVSDEDELTTAIVKAFLNHPKPTPTAIGKELGIHHYTIIRKLERLAGKFDSKKHGDYRDFLVAI